ncbi:MAG: DUF805 domain-containing protein [Rhodospirillales bacterium]|nr:DUF805 domain-containing protein [Rhodospirillales bacterium]
MSKPVFEDIFSFSGRRNRKSYLLYGLAVFVLLVVLYGILFAIAAAAHAWWPIALVYLLMIPLAISGWAVVSQRCRDFGWTGWAALITLIPVVGFIFAIALWFIPGNPGTNRYGPDPLGGAA